MMIHRLTMAVLAAFAVADSSATEFAQEFLSQFGYLPSSKDGDSITTPDMISEAIKEYQKFMNLDPTGILDSETIEMMEAPRCGMPDKDWGSPGRYKRGNPTGTKWESTDLTYKVSKYGTQLSRTDTDRALRAAFDIWSEVTPLRFTQKTGGSVNFDIRFERQNHSSYCNPFDGRGKVLAHAFFPPAAGVKPTVHGNTHFDDEETWTMGSRGINLLQVAVHEIGHAIGLRHSDVPGAVMFPTYRYQANFKLQQDDIDTIQMVYGKPEGNRGTRTWPEKETPGRCICKCEGNQIWFFDKKPGLGPRNIVDDGQEDSYKTTPYGTQQSTYPEPIPEETPQFPDYQPSVDETPQPSDYQPSVDETPQFPDYQPSVDETPQPSDYQPSVDETPQFPDYQPSVNETPQSPYYQPSVDETPQFPDYQPSVDETQQFPDYQPSVDETPQFPDYQPSVDETPQSPYYQSSVDESPQSPDYQASVDETPHYPYYQHFSA